MITTKNASDAVLSGAGGTSDSGLDSAHGTANNTSTAVHGASHTFGDGLEILKLTLNTMQTIGHVGNSIHDSLGLALDSAGDDATGLTLELTNGSLRAGHIRETDRGQSRRGDNTSKGEGDGDSGELHVCV
jgi:hypothetical protein